VQGQTPQYVEPGFVLAREDQTVYGYPFDTSTLKVTGDRVALLQRVGSFRAANAGAVAFRSAASGGVAQAAWISRTGQLVAAVGPELAANAEMELAPDGRHAATVRLVDGVWNLWLLETARGVLTRLTSSTTIARWPTWSPDSRRIAYGDAKDLYVIDLDGAGTPQKLLEDKFVKSPSDWSPDGRFLIYRQAAQSAGAKGDLWVLPLQADRTPFPFVATGAEETRAQFSPDGRWVAYESDESGRLEVYVRPFQRAGERVVISLDGGIEPRWNSNGREIFFISPSGAVMSAAVRPSAAGSVLDVEPARQLFQSRLQNRGLYPPNFKIDYDVSRGGERFLMLQATEKAEAAAITVVANWRPKT
jgi:Tol biopolymer transport system component